MNFDFTSDGTATATEIRDGLIAAVNGGSEPVTAAAVDAAVAALGDAGDAPPERLPVPATAAAELAARYRAQQEAERRLVDFLAGLAEKAARAEAERSGTLE